MKISSIYQLYKTLESDNLSFIYQGHFTNPVLAQATDLIRTDIETDKGFSSLGNKLSFLMIENFQNIAKYGDAHEADEPNAIREMFMTRNVGDAYYICSANLIDNENVESVKSRLEKINQLDKDALKKFYIEVLSNKKISKQGGAGLGFIEMVRKTNEKLDFAFVKFSEEHSIFYVQIKLKNKFAEEMEVQATPIEEAINLHKYVNEQNILLIHKGNYNADAIKPVLSMVEDNIDSQDIAVQKRLFHILVEILQNISKHSYGQDNIREGLFTISHTNKQFIVSSGNFILNEEVTILKSHIDHVNTLDKTELNKFYMHILMTGKEGLDGSAGLGIIDIARESMHKLEYEFVPIDDKISFFSLIVKLSITN